MKQWIRKVGIALIGLAFLGGLVVSSGIIPMEASTGHWPITRWFLQFAKKRSVATQSLGIVVPELRDPDLLLRGAGAYHTNCAMCHGTPRLREPVVPAAMTPNPPYLAEAAVEYKPRELFYIVKHGLKFTGMPAWPAYKREDEVWAVVAFLQELPGLDAAQYEGLVWGGIEERLERLDTRSLDPEMVRSDGLSDCVRCHGVDGLGRGEDAFPVLAGQSQTYMTNALEAYARGERYSGIMEPMAAGLSEMEREELATYFATLDRPRRQLSTPERAASARLGERIAMQGDPSRRVPSCVDCHDPEGVERKDAYPLLDGQSFDYLVQQLELFKKGRRGGSENAHLMHSVVKRLTPEQMQEVAAYFAQR